MTRGEQDVVSSENEAAVRRDVVRVCEVVLERSAMALKELHAGEVAATAMAYSKRCIEQLWLEERGVASAVLESVKAGVKF